MIVVIFFIFLFLGLNFTCELASLTVGSNGVVSRQNFITFPSVDSDNLLLGFAAFEKGFKLESLTTTATWNALLPVGGSVNLDGGTLWLENDLKFESVASLNNYGRVFGQGHTIEFLKTRSINNIPDNSIPIAFNDLTFNNSEPGDYLYTVDWSFDDKYIVIGSDSAAVDEAIVFYFDGQTLTPTASAGLGNDVLSARFHPSKHYVAFSKSSAGGNELFIYYLNVSNGTFTFTDGRDIGSTSKAVAWHPSGNYLVLGTNKNSSELILYSFDDSTGLMNQEQIINLNPNRDIAENSLSFSEGGDYLVVGTKRQSSASPIMMYKFDGSKLIFEAEVDPSVSVEAVDYSPTGTYVAVGLSDSTERIRIYEHDVAAQTLTEVVSARIGQTQSVFSLHWNNDGTLLAVGTENILDENDSEMDIYFFDKVNKTLILITQVKPLETVYEVRWSRDNTYLARATGTKKGAVGTVAVVSQPVPRDAFFDSTNIVFHTSTKVFGTWNFGTKVKIASFGNRFDFQEDTNLVVRANTTLTFENVLLTGLSGSNLRCLSNDASIIFQDCMILLSNDYTFSMGSILFRGDNVLSGSTKIIYSSSLASTIAKNSMLLLDCGITYSYVPSISSKNLLHFENEESTLYLDGSTLYTSHTGLHIERGKIIFDNKSTLSSDAFNFAEGFEISNDVNVQMLSNAELNIFGNLRFV